MEVQRPKPAQAISLHVIGENGIGQQRHMSEHVVEDIRLLQIIQLVGLADEAAGHETPVGEMLEEHRIRHKAGHRHHLPAGQLVQAFGQFVEIGNSAARQAQTLQPFQERRARPALQHRGLAREKLIPHLMFARGVVRPFLRNDPVAARAGRRMGKFARHALTPDSCI